MANTLLYKPEFCQILIDEMSRGMTYGSVAGTLGVSRRALYKWEKEHPEWKEAKEIAFAKNEKTLINMALNMAAGKLPGCNATVWIFMMKNIHGWRDKSDYEVTLKPPSIEVKTSKGDTYTIKHEE